MRRGNVWLNVGDLSLVELKLKVYHVSYRMSNVILRFVGCFARSRQ